MSDLPLFIAVLSGLVALHSALLLLIFRKIRVWRKRVEQSQSGLARLTRELAQHRYTIALLHQMIEKNRGRKIADKQHDVEDINIVAANQLAEDEIKPNDKQRPASKEILIDHAERLKNHEILEFIKKSVRNNDIALAFQPVVTLPKREVVYQEIFSRINVPGQGYLPAHKFISIAKSNNLMGAIDNILLLKCLQLLKDKAENVDNIEFFINTNSQTFTNKDYLSGLVRFLAANPRLSSKLIFEMSQDEWVNHSTTVKNVLDNLSLLGCRFSMDQVTMLSLDMGRMAKQNISFVKLDSNILLNEMASTAGLNRVKKMMVGLVGQRINVILEKVENEKQYTSMAGIEGEFGQGYLFGAPVIVE